MLAVHWRHSQNKLPSVCRIKPSLVNLQRYRFTPQGYFHADKSLSQVILFPTCLLVETSNTHTKTIGQGDRDTLMPHKTWPIWSLVELKNVFVTAGGSEVALTGGAGQVIKANHLACHQLDTPVKLVQGFFAMCELTCSWCMSRQSAAAAGWNQSPLKLPSSHTPRCKPGSTCTRCSGRYYQQCSQAPGRFWAQLDWHHRSLGKSFVYQESLGVKFSISKIWYHIQRGK